MNVATAHLVANQGANSDTVLAKASEVLATQFGIDHATLQVESDSTNCHEMSW